MKLDRRSFIALFAAGCASAARGPRSPILLRSSWQTVNIGDIAHTPGALALLEKHLPDQPVVLWPVSIDRGVEDLLRRRFPAVRIVKGNVGSPEVDAAFAECRLLVHGSGPSVVRQADLEAWSTSTGKPFGIYGVTLGDIDGRQKALFAKASFVYCRDSDSLKALEACGIKGPVTGLAPDATFGLDLRDDAAADALLAKLGLAPKSFLCAVPRLRYTPYWKIRGKAPTAEDQRRDAVSEKFAEADHAKLREAIVAWVRETGKPVLACPEMTYQVELLGPLLVDPLPADVKPKVRNLGRYWLTDEAASVYARARAVLSCEMHSPIIAAANGTPAVHVRQPEDTRKGRMWSDIGLGDWLFEVDATSGADLAKTVLSIDRDYAGAQATLAKAMAFVGQRQRETLSVLARS
jgi:hypothetical protein